MIKDGKHFKVENMMPGENAAPMHPHCRCSAAPWEDSDEYEAWLDYLNKGGTTEEWNKRLLIRQPGSSASFKRSLQEISEGKAGLDKRRQNMLNRLPESGSYHRYERESIQVRDLAYLSAATDNEFALFRSKTEDIIIRGDKSSCDMIPKALEQEIIDRHYEWVAHSHVDKGALKPSPEDRKTLSNIGQKKSKLIGLDGTEMEYTVSVFDD